MNTSHSLPVVSLYTSAGQRKYLNADERRRFLIAADHCERLEVRTLCLTIALTGCRISEALRLRRNSLDPSEGAIAIRCLKKRNGAVVIREVPVPEMLIDLLLRLDRSDDEQLWPFCRSRAWQLVKEVMADAGIAGGPHATPKGLRHGFGIHALRSSVPINFVQRWLGHQSMTTTAIYLQAIGSEEREIAARMWECTDRL